MSSNQGDSVSRTLAPRSPHPPGHLQAQHPTLGAAWGWGRVSPRDLPLHTGPPCPKYPVACRK